MIEAKNWFSTRHNKRVHCISVEGTSRKLVFNDEELRELATYIQTVLGGHNEHNRTD
jgi:hypothetical protein